MNRKEELVILMREEKKKLLDQAKDLRDTVFTGKVDGITDLSLLRPVKETIANLESLSKEYEKKA